MISQVDKMTSFIVMDVLDKAKELESKGINVIHLEVGEPDFEPSQCVVDAAKQAFDDEKTHYTHSLGDIELRREIVNLYQKEYKVNISPEQIVVTSGSSPAILMSMMVLGKEGGEVIITDPGYACYKNFAYAAGLTPRFIKVSDEGGYLYPEEELKKAINKNTVAIMINSPMNPTGTLVTDDMYKQLLSLNIPVISDEIYHGLVYGGRAKSILEFTTNAFVLNGFSKRYAMTGLRLGYLIAPMQYMRKLQIIQQNLFLCAPSISQEAAKSALRDSNEDVEKRNEIYNERRIYMLQRLREIGFVIETEPLGAFYIFANAKRFTQNSLQFAYEVLEHAHVGITPGIDFGANGEGYVRFSYANSLENIKEGLDRLERYLKEK